MYRRTWSTISKNASILKNLILAPCTKFMDCFIEVRSGEGWSITDWWWLSPVNHIVTHVIRGQCEAWWLCCTRTLMHGCHVMHDPWWPFLYFSLFDVWPSVMCSLSNTRWPFLHLSPFDMWPNVMHGPMWCVVPFLHFSLFDIYSLMWCEAQCDVLLPLYTYIYLMCGKMCCMVLCDVWPMWYMVNFLHLSLFAMSHGPKCHVAPYNLWWPFYI